MLQLQKDTEGAQRLTTTSDIPVLAGNSNLKLERASATQVHGLEAGTSDEGFKTARGDDSSLNAFGSLTHRGQRPQTAD